MPAGRRVVASSPACVTPKGNTMSYRKVGGLHFVKVWKFGFSFYVAKGRRSAYLQG